MKKNFAYGFLALCAVLVFWACGEGSLEWAEDEDYLAIEKFESISDADVLLALEQCEGDPDCIKEITKSFRENPISRKDTPSDGDDEQDTLLSSSTLASSSSKKVEESSSSEDIELSSADEESSSSEVVALSSSGVVPVSSTVAESSSSVVPTSSEGESESSSSEEEESSSSEEEESSSSEEDESSSSEECSKDLIETSVCRAASKTAYVGDEVTWTVIVPGKCAGWTSVEWTFIDAVSSKNTETLSASFVFGNDMIGEKVYPDEVVVKKGRISGSVNCESASVTLSKRPVEVSSSSAIPLTSSASVIPSSSSTVKPKSSNSAGGCYYNEMDELVCPSSSSVAPVVSSSSVTPVVSSSSVTPVVSSSSVTPVESSSSAELPTIAITGTQQTFPAGSYNYTCTGGGQLVCSTTDGTDKYFTVNGSQCQARAGHGWGSCGSGSCSSGTLTTTFDIVCTGQW